jgi:hypothetical protein
MRGEGPGAAALTTALLCVCILGSAQLGHCQTFDAWPQNKQSIADYVSTGIVAGTIGADVLYETHEARQQGLSWQAGFGCPALKYTAVNLAAIGLKSAFPRERPNHLNNQDSFSEHTANVTVTAGPWWVDLVMGVVVGYFRGAANMHDLEGVLEGFGLGLATRGGVRLIPACRSLS